MLKASSLRPHHPAESAADSASSPPLQDILLATTGLGKEYYSVPVLMDINFQLRHGEIVGLVGENGAGKSTLCKCLNGMTRLSQGSFVFAGRRYRGISVIQARAAGIVSIPQETDLIDELSIYENIFLGRELRRPCALLDRPTMRARSAQVLQELESNLDPERLAGTLSLAEKQQVEIAKALEQSCRLLIMDEPTTVLNAAEIRNLFYLMRKLRAQGTSILFISHKLREVKEIADSIAILRDGRLVCHCPAGELSTQDIASRMVGREFRQSFPPKRPAPENAAEVLRLHEICSGSRVRGVSFSLRRGEILGLCGLPGSGRTELAECLYGSRRISTGEFLLCGIPQRFRHPREAVAAGIAYLPEDRQGSGILGDFSVRSNTTLVSLPKYCHPFISVSEEKRAVWQHIVSFSIKPADSECVLRQLSGGNQQKVAIAKGLDSGPLLFIFAEPTRGIDLQARSEVYNFIHRLLEQGIACLLISSDLEEVIGLCRRVGVMREGRLEGFLEDEAVSEENIMYLATGVGTRHTAAGTTSPS